ncbi:MAG: DUF6252 family protein [Xanthomarina sp.]
MKLFRKKTLVLLVAFAATISSCSSDDDNNDGNNPTTNHTFFTAKVGGTAFESVTDQANGIFHLTNQGTPFFSVQGVNTEGHTVNIQVATFNGAGTYQIGEDSSPNIIGIGSYMPLNQIPQLSSTIDEGPKGQLIITEYTENGRVAGTFHFYVQNILTEQITHITEGSFNTPVTTITE